MQVPEPAAFNLFGKPLVWEPGHINTDFDYIMTREGDVYLSDDHYIIDVNDDTTGLGYPAEALITKLPYKSFSSENLSNLRIETTPSVSANKIKVIFKKDNNYPNYLSLYFKSASTTSGKVQPGTIYKLYYNEILIAEILAENIENEG